MIQRIMTKFRYGFSNRYIPVLAAGVAVILTLPALWTGWALDDYHHPAVLARLSTSESQVAFGQLFRFAGSSQEQLTMMRDLGGVPWWVNEHLRAAFFRPLSELTHLLDYALWPQSPVLMHAQSLLWFGIAVLIFGQFYRKIMGAGWAAGLAALLFAFDNAHVIPAAWISQRNTLISACFGGLALLAHVSWHQENWRPGVVFGSLSFLCALLAGESGLSVGAYLIAYTLFLDTAPVRQRMLAFLPYFAVAGGWSLAYRALGFGTRGSGMYLDPGQQTWQFLRALPERTLSLVTAQLAEPSAEMLHDLIAQRGMVLVMLGMAGFLLLFSILLYPVLKRERDVRFWAAGMVLALFPIASTTPDNRLLFFVGLGGMAIIARIITAWLDRADWLPVRRSWRIMARGLVVVLIVIHGFLAPLLLLATSKAFPLAVMHNLVIQQPAMALPNDPALTRKDVILVNPPVPLFSAYILTVRASQGLPVPAHLRILALGTAPLRINRKDARTLEIDTAPAGFLESKLEQFLRGPQTPMMVGQRIELSGMTVEVLALKDGWQPSRVRFTFDVLLEDDHLVWLKWKNDGFIPYSPPAVGVTETLEPIDFLTLIIEGFRKALR